MDNVIDTKQSIAPVEIKYSGLTNKQSKFVDAYIKLNNGPQAAISAGYSAKSAQIEACRLLKHPGILLEIDNWRKTKRIEITKTDFVDMAISDYKQLDVTEPNKPRFLDLAGKVMGYIGNNNDNPSTITNNTQINIKVDASQIDLWQLTRSLLGQ